MSQQYSAESHYYIIIIIMCCTQIFNQSRKSEILKEVTFVSDPHIIFFPQIFLTDY